MKKDNWIQNILDSTNGMTQVNPSNDLLLKIHKKINNHKKVSDMTVCLVASFITILVMINFIILIIKIKGC
jgi:hypothetical protein